MRIYTELLHKRVLTPMPTDWARMLLRFQWQRLHPAAMRPGNRQTPNVKIQLGSVVLCKILFCKHGCVSQAGGCEEWNVFWQSKTALSLAAVGPV